MDQLQARQQRLHAPMRGIEGDHHGHGALGADHPDGRARDALELGHEDRLGTRRHQPRERLGLGRRLVRGQHQAVDADQDGQGGEHGQQGVEADASDIERRATVLGAPPRAHGDAEHGRRPVARVIVELGQPPPIHRGLA